MAFPSDPATKERLDGEMDNDNTTFFLIRAMNTRQRLLVAAVEKANESFDKDMKFVEALRSIGHVLTFRQTTSYRRTFQHPELPLRESYGIVIPSMYRRRW